MVNFKILIYLQLVNKWLLLLLLILTSSCNSNKDSNYVPYDAAQIHERFSNHLIEDFPSKYVSYRTLEIFAPIQMDQDESYPVLYMFDGQNIFHPSPEMGGASSSTLNIDGIIDSLSYGGLLPKMIVVGIFHTPLRMSNYMPEKPRELLKQRIAETTDPFFKKFQENPPSSDNELRFVTEELKPYIDANFRTKPDQQNTFIAGWSVGALLSTYAVCEYPETFGGAINFSPYWPAFDGVFIDYLKENLPDPKAHKFYFDFGQDDLKNNYNLLQNTVDEAMTQNNFTKDVNWKTKAFDIKYSSEKDWRLRVSLALQFILE